VSGSPHIAAPAELRLFPLQSVLFPGATLPLQVFEERYRLLVAECIEEGAPFGVALIAGGEEVGDDAVEPHTVGASARITMHETLPDGRILLRAEGERRFRIRALHRDRPYLWAEVEYLEDGGTAPTDLAAGLRGDYARLRRLRAAAGGGYERDPALPTSDGVLADRVAAEGARFWPLEELQRTLEAIDVGERLRLVAPILATLLEAAELQEQEAAARLRPGAERLN
jgi:Lon protease-like protein